MNSLTPLGKFLRKLRIDRNELLRDMAKKLGVAMSFLSAVENGKKKMPSDWMLKLSELYELREDLRTELDAAIAESENGIDVKFDDMTPEHRQLTVAFARKIRTLSSKQRDQLQQILFEGF